MNKSDLSDPVKTKIWKLKIEEKYKTFPIKQIEKKESDALDKALDLFDSDLVEIN